MKDEVVPGAKWQFDGAVTDAFDDMLKRSVPDYDRMRELCFQVGRPHVDTLACSHVLDLGCSRGEALVRFVDTFGAANRFIGVDVSEPMLAAARERFDGMIKAGVVQIANMDIRDRFPVGKFSLTLAILTIQFTPIEHRQKLLRHIFKSTLPGGAFIMVEKVLGATHEIDAAFVDCYYDEKRANGYTQEQIDRKRLALEGVLVPVTAAWNEDLLKGAGFRQVDCFWRHLNFAGWLAVKD